MDGTEPAPTPQGSSDMPEVIRAETQALLRILQRHELTQADLARLTGYSAAYLSRVTSGQYPVTAEMFRVLFAHTGDLAIAECLGLPAPSKPPEAAPLSLSERLDDAQRKLIHAVLEASECARAARMGVGSDASVTRSLDALAEATTQMQHACAAFCSSPAADSPRALKCITPIGAMDQRAAAFVAGAAPRKATPIDFSA